MSRQNGLRDATASLSREESENLVWDKVSRVLNATQVSRDRHTSFTRRSRGAATCRSACVPDRWERFPGDRGLDLERPTHDGRAVMNGAPTSSEIHCFRSPLFGVHWLGTFTLLEPGAAVRRLLSASLRPAPATLRACPPRRCAMRHRRALRAWPVGCPAGWGS